MASFSGVRAAVAARLDTIDGLTAYASVPATVNVPCAVVLPAQGTFLAFDSSTGSDDVSLTVLLLVSAADDGIAQAALDGYLAGSGAGSVRTALNGNLGGATGVDYAVVTSADGYGLHTVAGIDYFGCLVQLTVGVTVA